MRRPHRRTWEPPLQLELGLAKAPATSATLPAWTALPEATQQRLTELLPRLLVAHRGDGGAVSAGSDVDER